MGDGEEAEEEVTQIITDSFLPTPILHHQLNALLKDYPLNKKLYLFNGFEKGFELGFEGEANSIKSVRNLVSADEHEEIIDIYLKKEIDKGRIAGPFNEIPFSVFQINPFGVVPKKVPGSFRIIVNLSYPKGDSINDFIPREYAQVSYSSIQEAAKLLVSSGRGSFLAKTDIESAFRLIPLNPNQYHLLVYQWKNKYYHDKTLPMGASSSCQIFEAFSSALEYIAQKFGIEYIVHYLDDFLVINALEKACYNDLRQLMRICKCVNVPLAEDKTFGPSQNLIYLGLEFDTIAEEIRLPNDKLETCKSCISHLLSINKCKKRELESLLGLLSFTCQVILPGRAFLLHMYGAIAKLSKPWFYIRLSKEIKEDLKVWLIFLQNHNGVTLYRDELFLSSKVWHLFSDAAKTEGFGAFLGNQWFADIWPSSWWPEQTIVLLEFIPIFLAVQIWGPQLKNCYLTLHSDNLPLVHNINKQSSKEKLVRSLLRKLVFEMLKHNIMFQAVHVPGFENTLADKLSRLQISAFKELHPSSDQFPATIPKLPDLRN